MSEDYGSGYGQALADVLRELKAAYAVTDSAMHGDEYTGKPSDYVRVRLAARKDAIRWVRAIVKGMRKP